MESNVDKAREFERVINTYGDLLMRTCFFMLKNKQDAEDVVQETFFKYMTSDCRYDSEEHIKAWLLRVSQNKCKNLLRYKSMHSHISYADIEEGFVSVTESFIPENDLEEIIEIADLDYKYKSVVILYYLEDYNAEEVAEILGLSPAAVRKRLQRAREKLKITYEKIYAEGGEI